MMIIGLTGSIGMGKSHAANVFARLGVPTYDADRAVHRLFGAGGAAVDLVAADFPGVVRNGAVDREALGARVFGDRAALARLEAIVHPLVRRQQRRFLLLAARRRRPAVVLDVPLLFETGGQGNCDLTVVVSAPPFVQRRRVLAREGMSAERLAAIRARQMSEAEKRRLADVVLPTGLGKRFTLRRIARLVTMAKARRGRKWRRVMSRV